jgi:Asp-tRNA(Asn)/Glu-tRNA(Gln) amidotransferase A subunit family amidase
MLDATAGAETGEAYSAPYYHGSFLDACQRSPGPLKIAVSREKWGRGNYQPCTLAGLENTVSLLEGLGRLMGQFHVMLAPTLSSPPVPVGYIGEAPPEEYADRLFGYMGDTGVYNQTGQPSISLPLHWSPNQLPIGMMFSAAYGNDALLLQLARQLEHAVPWWDRRPPLHTAAPAGSR